MIDYILTSRGNDIDKRRNDRSISGAMAGQ